MRGIRFQIIENMISNFIGQMHMQILDTYFQTKFVLIASQNFRLFSLHSDEKVCEVTPLYNTVKFLRETPIKIKN